MMQRLLRALADDVNFVIAKERRREDVPDDAGQIFFVNFTTRSLHTGVKAAI